MALSTPSFNAHYSLVVSPLSSEGGYGLCRGFRFMKRDDYFQVNFDHFGSERHFLRQLGQ